MRFVREHAYETALAALILLFGGSIVAFHRSVVEAMSAYPMQIAVMVVLAALVGAFLYSLLDRKESLVERERQKGETERERMRSKKDDENRKREQEEREREAEREQARLDDCNLTSFKEEDGRKKAMAAAIYKSSGHKVAIQTYGMSHFKSLDYGAPGSSPHIVFFEFDDRGDFAYVELVSWLRDMFDKHPEQLDDFTDEMMRDVGEILEEYNPF